MTAPGFWRIQPQMTDRAAEKLLKGLGALRFGLIDQIPSLIPHLFPGTCIYLF